MSIEDGICVLVVHWPGSKLGRYLTKHGCCFFHYQLHETIHYQAGYAEMFPTSENNKQKDAKSVSALQSWTSMGSRTGVRCLLTEL